MRSRSTLLVLAGGVVGVLGTLFVTGPSLPPAAAQNLVPMRPVGAYQVSSYAAGPGITYGAYVVDTATGEVFIVQGNEKPRSLGVVPKK